ncbi:hypothetical protein HW44_02255, partial [Nitrosococcus oceani]
PVLEHYPKIEHSRDREIIGKWLNVSLVKRLFGGTSDSVLNQIRKAFTDNVVETPIAENISIFPTQDINKEIRKDTGVSDEFIEELLMTQKDDRYAFSLLALLFPQLDFKNNDFHKDHLHPVSKYDELSEQNKEKFGWQTYNSLKNLQMLDANENMSKNGEDLESWVTKESKSKQKDAFLVNHYIPDVSLELSNFDEFITKRTEVLTKKLKEILA